MAKKRMFDKEIINTNRFLDLPISTKAVYLLLGMEADDEGFVTVKKVLRLYGGTEEDINILDKNNLVIPVGDGVVVITDWYKNNYLNKKRITPTIYQQEKKSLTIKNDKYVLVDEHKFNESLTDVKPMFNECLTIEDGNIDSDGQLDVEKQEFNESLTDAKQMFNECLTRREENRVEENSNYTPPTGAQPPSEEMAENNLFEFLEEAWGRTLSSFEMELISTWENDEITRYAIKESVKCNARSIKYVERIIENLKAKGIKTEAEAIKESDNFKSKRNKKTYSNQKETLSEKMKRLEKEAEEYDRQEENKND